MCILGNVHWLAKIPSDKGVKPLRSCCHVIREDTSTLVFKHIHLKIICKHTLVRRSFVITEKSHIGPIALAVLLSSDDQLIEYQCICGVTIYHHIHPKLCMRCFYCCDYMKCRFSCTVSGRISILWSWNKLFYRVWCNVWWESWSSWSSAVLPWSAWSMIMIIDHCDQHYHLTGPHVVSCGIPSAGR